MEIKFVLFYDMSAFWLRFVPLPLRSARWRLWTHAQWQQETWLRLDPTSLPEPSLWNEWYSLNLHLTSSKVTEFQLSQYFPLPTALHYSWLGQAAGLTHNGWSGCSCWASPVLFDLQCVRRVYIVGVDECKALGSQNEVSAVCVLLLLCAGSGCCR